MRFLVLLLLLTSGCVTLFPGSDAIETKVTLEQASTKDVIVVKDIQILPRSPLLPEQEFDLSFIIENQGDTSTVDNIIVDIFDAPLIKNKKDIKCNQSKAACASQCSDDNPCSLLPGEQKLIVFELKAPSNNEIAGLKTDLSINFKVLYDFSANTLYRVPVVDLDEIRSRQKAGDKTSVEVQTFIGEGPIQITPELKSPYLIENQKFSLVFVVSDRGSGNLEKQTISANDFKVGLNPDKENEYAVKIDSYGNILIGDGGLKLTNQWQNSKKDVIEIYRDESIPLLYSISSDNIDVPFKTYDIISAVVKYTYELRNSFSLTIQPLRNLGG